MTIMAQPAQDMDISSSITLNHNLLNNNSSKKFYNKEITMDEKNKISLKQMHKNFINIPENYQSEKSLNSKFANITSFEDSFPWLINFNKIMCSSVGSKSSQLLECLLSLYTENILTSINTYCEKAFDMTKLKAHMNSTLTFFHFYWCDIKEYVSDCDSYLNGMSMLLVIYIDMELKTFRQTKDFSSITTKLLSILWIYLDNSEKHIFRVLLKLKLVTKKYMEICEPIFRKSFTNLKRNIESLTDVDYVRYLLVLKMWKRIKEDLEEKKKVNKIALTILGPRVPKIRDELLKIIPKPPIGQESETLWLLRPNAFDLKTACNNFLAFEDAMSVQLKNSYSTKISNLNASQKSQIISLCSVNHIQEYTMNCKLNRNETCTSQNSHFTQNTIDFSRSTNEISSVKKKNKYKKHKRSKLKPGEIILIDLTKDDESLIIDKSKSKKKNCKRKLEWLKMIKKKYKEQRQVDEVICRNKVEIVDAHSTENSENSVDKILLKYLPISGNKVSESTENCILMKQKPFQDDTHYIHSDIIHDYICNKRNKQLKCAFQHTECDNCALSLQQNNIQSNIQHNRVLSLLKLLSIVEQNIKEPKAILNLFRECSEQNLTFSQHCSFCRNTSNETSEINTQGKEELFSQSKSSMETILLSKECQNSIINAQSIKQELPTSMSCNMTETDYSRNASVYVQSNCYLQDFRSMNSHSSQVTEAVKENISCNVHECTSNCKKTEAKPFFCHNYNIFNAIRNEDTTQNIIDDNTTDKKSMCDKNIICMLSDLDKCMDVLNRISEHIMTVHAEKQRLKCSDKTDVCAVSTTVFGDQIAESSLGWTQNINSLPNSEKLSKILELYGKKEFQNAFKSKDFHRCDERANQLKCEPDTSKKLPISTSQSKELHFYGKDHNIFSENKLSENFIYTRIKSEFEEPIKQEVIMTNDQAHTMQSLPYDLKHVNKKQNQDMYYESTLQDCSWNADLTKTCSIEQFENIDILDSILNGDITIEDEQEIFENLQSPLILPIDYDNSSNVLNCISEFFLQSEHMHINEKEKRRITSDVESSPTLLPEGSLGTTGILNSLLDFELTDMDSPPNDFMYSNVHAVNPRLIRKSFEGEILSAKNESQLNSQEKMVTDEKDDTGKIRLQNEEKLYNDQSNSINSSVNLIGFELNTSREETFEFPSLIKSLSSFSGHSPILVNTDNISSDKKESFPKYSLSSPIDKLNTDTAIEKSYIFHKEDIINQVQSSSNIVNQVSPNIHTSNNFSLNTLINCTSSKRDHFLSSDKHTLVELGTNSLVMKQPLDHDLSSSTDLMSCKTIVAPQCEVSEYKDSLKQNKILKNVQHNCKEEQNDITKCEIEDNVQSRSSKRKLKYRKKIKNRKREKRVEKREETISSIVESNQDELSLRCSQLTVINPLNHQPDTQSTYKLSSPSFHVSCCQKSPHPMSTSKNVHKQVKCIGIQRLRNISQRKRQILLNFHGNTTMNTVFMEDSKVENSQYIMEDNILENSSIGSKSMEKPHIPKNKTCFKFSNKNIKVDTDITELNLTKDKHVTEISNNILIKSGTKWTLQNINKRSSKFAKKQMIRTVDEERPAKKKKLSSKFSSALETNAVVSSLNQHETQKKHLASVKEGFVCTNRKKNMVGE